MAIRADQLQKAEVTISGNGILLIVGDLTEGTLDLTGHTVDNLSFADQTWSFFGPDDAIDVGTGAKLILRTDQVKQQSVTGAGTVYVAGNVSQGGNLDLKDIFASINFGDDENDVDPSITIAMNGRIQMNASQLEDVEGTINGPGTLILFGDIDADTDFSAFDGSVNLDVTDPDTVSTFAGFPQLDAGRTLIVRSDQVDGKTLTQTNANIEVVPHLDDIDGPVLLAGLSGLNAFSIDMYIDEDVTNLGALGSVKVHLEDQAIFTLSAGLANGVTIDGNGTTNITGDVTAGTVDLTKVTSTNLTFGDDDAIEVATGATLLVAADAIALDGASAVDITGGGTVKLLDADVTTVYDFTVVGAPGASLEFSNAGILDAATVLRSADGGISFVSLYDDAGSVGIDVTKMTAAQANGINFASSDGALHVTAAAGDQSLSGTLHNDVFEGGNSGTDAVNLGVGGGSDTLVWESTPANQMVITNFFANGDDGQNDVLDFSNLSLNNVNNMTGLAYQGLVSDPEAGEVPLKLTADIVGLTDLFATSAKSVETLFKSSGNFLNNLVDKDESIGKTSMVFLIANSADADADINAWLWSDTDDDGNVKENELTRVGTIKALGAEELTTENFSDNVQGQEQGFAPMGMFGGYIAEDIPPVNPTDTVHIMG